MKNIICKIAIVWSVLSMPYVMANPEQIELEAKAFTTSLEKHLRLIKARFPNDPNALRAVVEEVILTNVDAKYFAYKVLGKHVTKMTELQKLSFVDLLKTSMVNNYIAVLKHYNNESLLLETVNKSESGKTAKAKILIAPVNNSGEKDKKIVLAWRYNKEKGVWKIYDLEAEGISLLQSKQKEIASIINKQGIENMLDLLGNKAKITKNPEG